MQLTPLKCHALKALVAHQAPALVKCRGGFRPSTQPADGGDVIHVRTVRALEADQLLEFDDAQFPSEARLTPRGIDAAREAVGPRRAHQVEQLAKAVLQ